MKELSYRIPDTAGSQIVAPPGGRSLDERTQSRLPVVEKKRQSFDQPLDRSSQVAAAASALEKLYTQIGVDQDSINILYNQQTQVPATGENVQYLVRAAVSVVHLPTAAINDSRNQHEETRKAYVAEFEAQRSLRNGNANLR